MHKPSRYRTTLYEPAPREVPSGAQDALAHALGVASRLTLETLDAVTIRKNPNGVYSFHTHPDAMESVAAVTPLTPGRPSMTKRFPTLRQRGSRPLSGWYFWEGRPTDRIPDPPIPPKPEVKMGQVGELLYTYGFFTREHKLLGHAVAKPKTLALVRQVTTIRDRMPAPKPDAIPEGAFYVIVFEHKKYTGEARPILYGLTEDFLTQSP